MKSILISKFSFLLLALMQSSTESRMIKSEKISKCQLGAFNSVDLIYEGECSVNRDTLSYSYIIKFKNDSVKTVWVSPVVGFKSYQLSLQDDTGTGLGIFSSQDRSLDTSPPIQIRSKQILIKAWVIRSEEPNHSIIINWREE